MAVRSYQTILDDAQYIFDQSTDFASFKGEMEHAFPELRS